MVIEQQYFVVFFGLSVDRNDEKMVGSYLEEEVEYSNI